MYYLQVVVVCILIKLSTNPHVYGDAAASKDTTQFSRLFNEEPIVALNEKNLTSSIYNSGKSWVVGYFVENEESSTNFTAVLKKVAFALRILSDVSIAAINCTRESTPENVCMKQNITSYPTLKYYPPNAKDDSPGVQMAIVNSYEETAHNIFRLMNKYEKPGIKSTHPNIEHLIWTDEGDKAQNGGNQDSGKKTTWQTASPYIIYICIGCLALTIIIWSSYSIFKRFSRREVNVYSVLHKSDANDEDSIQVRLKT